MISIATDNVEITKVQRDTDYNMRTRRKASMPRAATTYHESDREDAFDLVRRD
jgi:hypothetical protein